MKQKVKDLLYILVIYIIALLVALLTLKYAPIADILWKTALADLLATIVVFVFSVIKNNSSVYDPYWSAAPIFIVFYWLYDSPQIDFVFKIIWMLVVLWGVRLTWNWILRWDGFKDEDWRYVDIKKKTGKFYWITSFFGIHLMPTVFVFLGLVPVYYTMYSTVVSWFDSWLAVLAVVFTLGAIYLEKTADDQLRRFLKTRKDKSERIQSGFWGYLDYPNYYGEMLFWWGLYFFAVAIDRSLWWTVFGPLSISLLFLFVSIPMMKKRVANKTYR